MDAIDIGLQSRNEPKVRDAPRSTGSDVIIEPVTVLLSSPAAIGPFFLYRVLPPPAVQGEPRIGPLGFYLVLPSFPKRDHSYLVRGPQIKLDDKTRYKDGAFPVGALATNPIRRTESISPWTWGRSGSRVPVPSWRRRRGRTW